MYISYYQWQSVRGGGGGGGGPQTFWYFGYFLTIWAFWANNWQGINNSHRTIKLWLNEEIYFHLIFTTYPNYPLALTYLPTIPILAEFFRFFNSNSEFRFLKSKFSFFCVFFVCFFYKGIKA